ncbi:hypothetical protein HanRHA438_Chr02g0080781 [Helianthus annuus]|nr:hypothetical protein HanRHA438_Chr02g0080781 [Helianthus annuus]
MSNPDHTNRMQLGKMNVIKCKDVKKKRRCRQTKVAITEEIPEKGDIPRRSICRRLPFFRIQSTPTFRKLKISHQTIKRPPRSLQWWKFRRHLFSKTFLIFSGRHKKKNDGFLKKRKEGEKFQQNNDGIRRLPKRYILIAINKHREPSQQFFRYHSPSTKQKKYTRVYTRA